MAKSLDRLSRNKRCCAGRDRDIQVPLDGIRDQREDIGPFQRIAAGQYQGRRRGKFRQLLDELQRLLCRQFIAVRLGTSTRATMVAHEVARLRDFVEDK
jgi:hypothetical protein